MERLLDWFKSRCRCKCPCGHIDVQEFGARGDGVCDDTLAIKNAIDALPARGGIVCFPSGIFKISETLKFRNGVIFQGTGAHSTTIKSELAAAVFQPENPSARGYFVHFRDLKIDNTNKDKCNSIGIDFTNISLGGIRNVQITNVKIGILLSDQAYYNDLLSPIILHADTGIKMVDGANENRVYGGKIDFAQIGITLDSVSNPQIYATSFENFTTGIEIGPTVVASPKIIGCRFENPSELGIGILISSSTLAAIIIGPFFQRVTTKIQDEATNTNIVANKNWKISGGTSVTKHLSVQQAIDFPPIAAHSTHEELVTHPNLSGTRAEDSVFVTSNSPISAGLMLMGIPVSDGVRVRMANITNATINPSSLKFKIDVWQH